MTVTVTTSRADYTGNGVTVAFTVPFYFLDNTHLTVIKTVGGVSTTLVLTTDYTVTGAGVAAGGTVTCVVAPANGAQITILRNVPLDQQVHYVPNDPFPAATHEQALDKLTMEVQQIEEQVSRTLGFSQATTGISTTLPTPSANLALKWNAGATALINTTYDPDAQVTLATAQATAAASSATASAASAASSLSYLNTFKGQYYGPLAADPALDPLGNAVTTGDLYWNTVSNKMRVYSGAAWGDITTSTNMAVQTFSGTGAQTAFTLSSSPGTVNALFVYISGVRQAPTTDYTLSGTTLTFTTAPPSGTNNILTLGMSAQNIGTPSDGTVTDAKLASGCVNGIHTIYIPAAAMTGRVTNGAVAALVESTTNKILQKSMDFADGATALYAQFQIRMPKSWDRGTITAQFAWTANSTSTNGVVWGIQGVALSDGETIDQAFGTAQTVTQANTATAYQLHITSATAAVTIGSTPASQDLVVFQVYRDPTNVSDTLAATASLLGVTINYTTTASTDA